MPSTKKQKQKNKSSSKKKKGATNTNSLKTFSIPPRSNEEIIGRVTHNSVAKRTVIAELEHALRYEIQSESHQSALQAVAAAANTHNTNTSNNKDGKQSLLSPALDPPPSLPITYETPGMVEAGTTPLIFGKNVRFEIKYLDLPEQKVQILMDEGMGEDDTHQQWPGGKALVMSFLPLQDSTTTSWHPPPTPLLVLLGECELNSKDLWDFAIQFRQGRTKFNWPGYWATLQCPFCANLAVPKDDDDNTNHKSATSSNTSSSPSSTFIMISQLIMQVATNDDGRNLMREIPRLCCKDCFSEHLQANSFESREAILKYSAMSSMTTATNAYTLSSFYWLSGMCAAVGRCSTEVLAEALNMSSTDMKSRISKSETKTNRGQGVVKIKTRKRRECPSCGLTSEGLSPCSQCHRVYYCGIPCQRRHWKLHKPTCSKNTTNNVGDDDGDNDNETYSRPQPSVTIREKKVKSSSSSHHVNADDLQEVLCKECLSNKDDEGCPAMCIYCGVFIVCGACSTTSAFGGENARPAELFWACSDCSNKNPHHSMPSASKPAFLLQRLLDKQPTGRHVLYTRLMLAQCKFNDAREFTGIDQDKEAAEREYKWLANDADYAPAQLALASFFDPLCRERGEVWDGPIPLRLLVEGIPDCKPSFSANKKIALQYYNRSVAQKWSTALHTVGTDYKNGDGLYPMNKSKAASMLLEAANLGDASSANNLGMMMMRGDGIPQDTIGGLGMFRQAAEHGLFQAMFILGQFGMQMPPSIQDDGRKWVQKLIEIGWEPPTESHVPMWMQVCHFYGLSA